MSNIIKFYTEFLEKSTRKNGSHLRFIIASYFQKLKYEFLKAYLVYKFASDWKSELSGKNHGEIFSSPIPPPSSTKRMTEGLNRVIAWR
jgi:hypothetical protein